MTREYILQEVKRTAIANGDRALGWRTFFQETGIKECDWKGKFWARWSDAVQEAGYTPNEMSSAYNEAFLLEKLVPLIRKYGRFPVTAELRLEARLDKTLPNDKTFSERLGSKSERALKVINYCRSRQALEDVVAICEALSTGGTAASADNEVDEDVTIGFVYLMKSGRFYKIGRSNAAGRRERELQIQLPEAANHVHVIRTDDPVGIEAYWHSRFAAKRVRKEAEWFELDSSDIKAFRRRKFM
jgi:hypothetical protein